MTPEELVLFHSGDSSFMRGVINAHSPRLLRFALSLGVPEDDVEDVLQDSWLRVYAKRATYSGRGSLFGWTLAVTRNICMAYFRRRRIERRRPRRESWPTDAANTSASVATGVPDEPSRVLLALAGLPGRQRQVVILRLLEDRSVEETARTLGCAPGTVKSTLSQALARLRSSLEGPQT